MVCTETALNPYCYVIVLPDNKSILSAEDDPSTTNDPDQTVVTVTERRCRGGHHAPSVTKADAEVTQKGQGQGEH